LIDHLLLANLIRSEKQTTEENQAREFKNLVFAHDVIPKVPGIFWKLYDDKFHDDVDEEELDWVTPQDEGDVQAMLSALRQTGWQG
jgi:hypothetical protein